MAVALEVDIDGLIVTGGLSRSERLIGQLRQRVGKLGPLFVYPGEREMEALAFGALRVLRGEEQARSYGAGTKGAIS